jgi:ATP-dependent DNA helicase PIF1
VAEINQECLDELCEKTGEVNDYVAELEVYDKKLPAFKIEKFKKDCPAVENLSLAVGCQVMLLWNLDLEQGLVNGSRGVVTRFINDIPLVRFLDGQSRLIDYHLWELEENDTKLASIEQLPLKLAYAISIHKSQGCSLDYVITDLDSIFEYGQAYVALSRVRTSGGLIIRNLRLKKIKANPKAKAYYQSLC